MFCSSCGKEVKEESKFCQNCGQNQINITADEESEDINLLESNYSSNDTNDIKNENELVSSEYSQTVVLEKESFFKKIFKGVGMGGLVVGGGFLYISFTILHFLFVAFVGLSMIGLAISLFSEGSIIWGLVALFLGTPIAIGFASYAFIFI